MPDPASSASGPSRAAGAKWNAFAAREPYFAVLTSPDFRRAHLTDEHRRSFFESGETLIASLLRTIELRLSPDFAPTAILEYGCGAGRLALPLARRARRRGGRVVAVDWSPAMIETTRLEARRQDVENVDLISPAALFAGARRFDFLTCYLVLQRMPPAEGLPLLRALVGRLVPGGIGVFHVPYRTGAPWPQRLLRRARTRLPGLNALVNLLRGKPRGDPFVASHVYPLADVLGVFDAAGFAATHVVFDDHADLASALIFAEAPIKSRTTQGAIARSGAGGPAGNVGEPADPAGGAIDVQALIARTSIAELNASAERYFATLTDVDHHLAKPFASADEAPWLLTNLSVLLQSLAIAPGMRVLEFGAGSGWLSRSLTQLGCVTILLDVSPAALHLARDLYARLPVIGARPAPQFLPFDGERIDLPDGSVERIVSFHAFHHAPNPERIIREFARILTPGGIAAFAEPGPRHSLAAQSQFEMRTYGVVENDVHVHDLWAVARAAGFADLKLSLFHGPAFHVSLSEYEDFLAGGPTTAEWVASTRTFLRNVRNFHLVKAGAEPEDSRNSAGLACEIHARQSAPREGSSRVDIEALVTNTGTSRWLRQGIDPGGVSIGFRLYDERDALVASTVTAQPLTDPPRDILPGETVSVRFSVPLPSAGPYALDVDCVAARVTWFSQIGSRAGRIAIE